MNICSPHNSIQSVRWRLLPSIEICVLIGLLITANTGLLINNSPSHSLLFDPTAVAQGELWRFFSWPLVHVSRYHLLLDGLAFVLLYRGLSEDRLSCRLLWVLCCALGSLLLPLVFSEQIYRLGLCGLSGVAHGLAAISGLEMLLVQRQRRIGAVLLVGLMLKVGFEVLSGQVVMQGLHLGRSACHWCRPMLVEWLEVWSDFY